MNKIVLHIAKMSATRAEVFGVKSETTTTDVGFLNFFKRESDPPEPDNNAQERAMGEMDLTSLPKQTRKPRNDSFRACYGCIGMFCATVFSLHLSYILNDDKTKSYYTIMDAKLDVYERNMSGVGWATQVVIDKYGLPSEQQNLALDESKYCQDGEMVAILNYGGVIVPDNLPFVSSSRNFSEWRYGYATEAVVFQYDDQPGDECVRFAKTNSQDNSTAFAGEPMRIDADTRSFPYLASSGRWHPLLVATRVWPTSGIQGIRATLITTRQL